MILPLVEELPSSLTSWQTFLALQSQPGLLFLDSALPHSTLGRYSFVTALPFAWVRSSTNPFDSLGELFQRYPTETLKDLPPFQGGAAGLFGYDLCHHLERLPRSVIDEFQFPEMAIGLYDVVFAFDHVQERAWLISTGFPELKKEQRQKRADERLQEFQKLLESSISISTNHPQPIALERAYSVEGFNQLLSNFTKDEYLRAIERAIEYVHAGDCFQVNLAQRLISPAVPSTVQLYEHLRECNPAPFAGYFQFDEHTLMTASPERFLQVMDRDIETRPIKGTRPCDTDAQQDARLREELLHSAKDRAENVMIVDLLRNDLGRVCEYGSINVEKLCGLETYRYVHHLVSVVKGRLRQELTPLDLLKAAFPGGSITGAPKVRAMEIIAELEPTSRGPYCGSLGYIGFDGTMDTNLLIRTFTQSQGWLQFPVGGGIVADSKPMDEYAETLHKGEGLIRALRLASEHEA